MPSTLAFDIGLAHTGVAISYENKIAQGLTTIHTHSLDQLQNEITQLIKRCQPDTIVLGVPQKGSINEHATLLKNRLETHLSIPVILVNEDFSSRSAQAAMIHANQKLKHRRLRDHQTAAASVLQLYLDNLIE